MTPLQQLWDDLIQEPRIPRAFYRIQFNPSFTFKDAEQLVPYLNAIGISDLYASPVFKPRKGSVHGYDIVNYNEFNPALGSKDDFIRLCKALKARDMSLILDIVPNHMGVSTENEWWADVLKHGPSSQYAGYFDIDWKPNNRILDNKLLLPVLHSHYGEVLEEGHIKVVYWHGDFYVHYYDNQFPMTPESYIHILDHILDTLPSALDDKEKWIRHEVTSVRRSLEFLPEYWLTDAESISIRRREQKIIRWRFLGLFDKSEAFRSYLQESLQGINGIKGESSSFDILDTILSEQPYYLAFWQVASDEINYRRFFDINDMAAVRTENLQVFADTHRLTFQLLAEGLIAGLRIDHPDGLWNPERYFWRLQSGYIDALMNHRFSDTPEQARSMAEKLNAHLTTLKSGKKWPLYVVGEKILSESEPLPDTWAIHGTTGYDFMYAANNLFVDRSSEEAFNNLYAAFIGEYIDFNELTAEAKNLIMTQSLTSEITALTAELARIVEKNRRFRGFTQNSLAFVMSEFMAALDIYRTYTTGPNHISDRDQSYIKAAMTRAKENNPLVPERVFDFLEDVLLMKNLLQFNEADRPALKDFVMKFQQITGPIMAKSVEDTAFYIYNRLVSLNEVGGHPDHFGIEVQDFHAHNVGIQQSYPHTMLSTSTHDTKRSEDVRCRINVLSEIPDEWHNAINTWAVMNAAACSTLSGQSAPSRNDEYLIYQTLLGTYDPAEDSKVYIDRIVQYMFKAINEAKTHSNWINPNQEYAHAISSFIRTIWKNEVFRTAFEAFHNKVAFFGRLNSLSQVLLKLTSPGVPDIYQGSELWNFSLVDPDNRRPVDFNLRSQLLDTIKKEQSIERLGYIQSLLENDQEGMIKFYFTYRTLCYRSHHPRLFTMGHYKPLIASGTKHNHLCAFQRTHNDKTLIAIIPRLMCSMVRSRTVLPVGHSAWEDTRVHIDKPNTAWKNILSDEIFHSDDKGALLLSELFAHIPYGLFVEEQ